MTPPHDNDGHDFMERASSGSGWTEWGRYVLKELRRISEALVALEKESSKARDELRAELSDGRDELRMELMRELKETNDKCNKMNTEIALLQLKAGMAGIIGGILVSILVRIITR